VKKGTDISMTEPSAVQPAPSTTEQGQTSDAMQVDYTTTQESTSYSNQIEEIKQSASMVDTIVFAPESENVAFNPWTKLNGTLNVPLLQKLKRVVCGIVMKYPGLSEVRCGVHYLFKSLLTFQFRRNCITKYSFFAQQLWRR